MAERVTVEIVGIDRASSALHSVGGALGRIAEIAAGILAFRTLERIASGIINLAQSAAQAYEWFNRIQFSLRELATADLIEQLEGTGKAVENWDAVFAQASAQAQELLDWVIKLSLTSPFTAEDVNQMFRLIRAYGFQTDEAKDLTQIILDFASATGFGSQVLERMGLALGQVRQRGRLAGEEIRQLINVGIPVRDILAKALGVTTAQLEKMIRAGKVGADVALPAIVEWMKRFDGASQRAVQTWHGLLANLKDVKQLNMIAVFDGIAKVMQPALQSLFNVLTSEEFTNRLREIGTAIGTFLAPIADWAIGLIENLDDLFRILDQIGNIQPGTAIALFFEWLGILKDDKVKAVADAINNFKDAIVGLADGFLAMLDPWIGPIKDELPGWIDNLMTIKTSLFEAFVEAWERFVDSMTTLGTTLAPGLIGDFVDNLERLTDWWEEGGGSETLGKITNFLLVLGGVGVVGALTILSYVFTLLVDVLTGADWETISGHIDTFTGRMYILSQTLRETEIFQNFLNTVDLISQILTIKFNEWGAPLDTFREKLTTWGMQLVTITWTIYNILVDWVNRIKGKLDDLKNKIGGWAVDAANKAYSAGRDVINALGNGMIAAANSVYNKLKEILDKILAIIIKIFKFGSPPKVFVDFGRSMMEGLALGFERAAAEASKRIAGAAVVASGVPIFDTGAMGVLPRDGGRRRPRRDRDIPWPELPPQLPGRTLMPGWTVNISRDVDGQALVERIRTAVRRA